MSCGHTCVRNVQSLCAQMNELTVGTHQLQCQVIFTGRAPLEHVHEAPEQWEVTIGGIKLPKTTGADLAEYQRISNKSFAHNLQTHLACTKAGQILYDSDKCTEDMAACLYTSEIDKLESSVSFQLSTMLQSPKDKDNDLAYFQIFGTCIAAAAQGVHPCAVPYAKCYGVKTPMTIDGPKSLFQPHTLGEYYMTLDRPFTIKMMEFQVGGDKGYKVRWDSPENDGKGIQVVWCWRYALGGNKGITFMQAGLMYLQLLSEQQHYHCLFTAAGIMKENWLTLQPK